MKSVCVFCGSRSGDDPEFASAAIETGTQIARLGLRLVYGGGSVGLMGVVADAALAAGGDVIGIIPEFLARREVMHTGLTELRIVSSMHERKAVMGDLSEAFIALPGGYGTLEELFEVITWSQLGLHRKPIGLLNTSGFFSSLLQFIDDGITRGFIRKDERKHLLVEKSPEELLRILKEIPPIPAQSTFGRSEI